MWNKLGLSFRSAGSVQQFKDLDGMEDEVCECNTFNCILCMFATLLGSDTPSLHLSISIQNTEN